APEDQWVYHATATVLRCRSFLASLPGVNAGQIGLTGISWGGYLATLAAGLDPDFSFVAPVYGCGFLYPSRSHLFDEANLEETARWDALFDPGRLASKMKAKYMLFTGTNDFAFPLASAEKTRHAVRSENCWMLRNNWPHDHTISWEEETIFDFADHARNNRKSPAIGMPQMQNRKLIVPIDPADKQIRSVELLYTRAGTPEEWNDCLWRALPAKSSGNSADGILPPFTRAAFFNVEFTDRTLYSSEIWRNESL
ncbi:MAG: prolyl oligopeptidase family serine peptidase, partial [Victivallaceae bacterium]|nr:prolyl oligopeptidase family serine peptidase [Victivallaceae bacterium]